MTQRPSQNRHGGFPDQRRENRPADKWLVYVALLPAVLTLAGIAITSPIGFDTGTSWHNRILSDVSSIKAPRGDADDYVEGLARLGIAKLPGYEPPSIVDSGSLSADPIETGVCTPLMIRVIPSDAAC